VKTFPLFRKNLRHARLNAGFTQLVLSERAEVSYKYYQDLEAGRLAGVTMTTAERISDALNIPLWQLLHPDAIPAPSRERARRTPNARLRREYPNPNTQIPNKLQIPKTKSQKNPLRNS